MKLSVYPTDTDDVRQAVVEQAAATGAALFTSLHIPEAQGLRAYGDWLTETHRQHGLDIWADVSPATLDALDIALEGAGLLADWGIVGLRIDFGFSPDEIRRLAAASGLRIALNASTVDAALLDELTDVAPIGWHNYYPRPETGISRSWLVSQTRLFTERGWDVVGFVPGETSFRAPLHLGLPMLEEHRGRPSYLAAVDLRALCPAMEPCCAEGALLPETLAWWQHLEQTGEVTLPLVGIDDGAHFLLDDAWTLRVEQTGLSQRLEGTRGRGVPRRLLNAATRQVGSVQMDLERYGRYAGEVHLMTTERPLDPGQARVADVAAPFAGLATTLRGGDRVRFVEWA